MLAWAYELTPDGVKRSTEPGSEESVRPAAARRLDWLILSGMVVVLALMMVDRVWLARDREAVVAVPPQDGPAERHVVTDRSIAVLPFADLSPAGDHAYFGDGIAEELLNTLARVRDLRVAGRTSSFYFRDRGENLRVIGEMLGVAYVLEGSVRKSAERVRITAQLVSTRDGYYLWSETYDGELKEIFDLQERIARAIISALAVVLNGEPRERIVEVATENTEAYSLFLQATAIFNRRDRDRMIHASELLQEALRLDPEFTRARSRLAAVLAVVPAYAPVSQDAFFAEAERQARAAITEAGRLAEPHAILGLLFSNQRRYSAAQHEFLLALQADPADITANFWFGIHLWMSGYRDRAVRHLENVLEADPMLPNGLNWRALAYLDAGDLANAHRLYQRAYDLGMVAASQGLGMVAGLQGDHAAATKLEAQMIRQAFAIPIADADAEILSAGVYGDEEDRERALKLIDDYLASGPERVHGAIPNLLMRIGRPEQALELAVSAPLINETLFFAPLWTRPFGDAARQSGFFPEFVRRIGLAEFWRQYGPPNECRPGLDGEYVCE